VWVTPPPVPVIVMVLVVALAPVRTVMVITDVPEPGAETEVGEKLTVTRDGTPDADSATAELKLPKAVAVIVEVVEPPQANDEMGEALRVKSPPLATAFTVRDTVAVSVVLPLAPVTVSV